MRNGAQQIRSQLFFFIFCPEALLLMDLCGERAGDNGNNQKGDKGNRIARNRKVNVPIRICKNKIDANHAGDGSDYAKEVASCQVRDQKNRKDIDGGGESITAISHLQSNTRKRGKKKNYDGDK